MYQQHFALTHYPFEQTLEPETLFDAAPHREAQFRLQHLL